MVSLSFRELAVGVSQQILKKIIPCELFGRNRFISPKRILTVTGDAVGMRQQIRDRTEISGKQSGTTEE